MRPSMFLNILFNTANVSIILWCCDAERDARPRHNKRRQRARFVNENIIIAKVPFAESTLR